LGGEVDDDILQAARVADGSVARALTLLNEDAQALRQRVLDLIAQLPNPDPRALHALGDALGSSDPQTLETFMDMINSWLSAQLTEAQRSKPQMARVAETWEKINRAARDVEAYNLERKPFAFAVFGALAEAARS
jgi:DNA polymerase III subunit delta'